MNEFCSRIVRIVEDAVRRDKDDLAESMAIEFSDADVKQRFRPDGFHYGEIEGEARIGVLIQQEKAQGWNLHLEFYWMDDSFGFSIRVRNKNPIQADKMSAAFRNSIKDVPSVYQCIVEGTSVRMRRPITVDEMGNLPNIVSDAIVAWCGIWNRIGGLKKFLGKAQGPSQ